MQRDEVIALILENMGTTKRYLHGHFQNVMQATQLSTAQLELLATIRQAQPAHTNQLAQQLCLTPGAISQLVDALEQHGFITRVTDPTDRRRQALTLSAKGEQQFKTWHKQRQAFFREIMRDMTDDELASWLHVQQKIITSLKHHKEK